NPLCPTRYRTRHQLNKMSAFIAWIYVRMFSFKASMGMPFLKSLKNFTAISPLVLELLQLLQLISESGDILILTQGLFASVRRCKLRETGQQFAAKFSSRARYGEDCSAEIHHEIALLSLCSPSSRIIGLHDVFETPKEIILVLEFAPGGDLQTIIDDNLVPFEADVVKFVRQMVEGLAYLHERKIAHLDIK
ncbi:hypothetical protein L9F63_005994, partial [Diploptera punctata]